MPTRAVTEELNNYLDRVREVYAEAAERPDEGLCCVDGALRRLPGLVIPERMVEMNYGCGSTVEPDDLAGDEPILYIGVGGGLEALQLAYFRRRPGGVVAADPVPEMRREAARNLQDAARLNDWFRPEFVRIVEGSAHELPVPDGSVGVAAQNCLFNVLAADDLSAALREVRRVLTPDGRFVTSDPITTRPLPEALRKNPTLRARCVAGCVSFEQYVGALASAGFGEVQIRARRPYRLLLPREHPELTDPILLESVDAVARPILPRDGRPLIYTGRTATYLGPGETARDGSGFLFRRGVPASVSDATAERLGRRPDFFLTPPTYNVRSTGCC
ncbi:MAG: methyltransferase domain-containing protein [Acidobacteriota bacterium]